MKLSRHLNNFSGTINYLFNKDIEIKPKKIKEASEALEKKYSLGTIKIPSFYDLDEILKKIEIYLESGGKLKDIALKSKRKIPWLLYFPDINSGLMKSSYFRIQFKSFLFSINRASHYHSYFFNYVKYYPFFDQEMFYILRNWINVVLKNDGLSKRLNKWIKLNKNFYFFEDEGFRKLSQEIQKANISTIELNNNAFFCGELKYSNYFKQVTLDLLKNVNNWLFADLMTSDGLVNVINFLCPETKLRFPELSAEIANSFLEPFYEKECNESLKRVIRTFCLDYFGHPNLFNENWSSVSPTALAVIKKWLVGQTLEIFFKIISDTAYDNHWNQRKQFWEKYYKAGFISDAWVVLGNYAKNVIKYYDDNDKLYYGQFARGSGFSSNKSALLIKIKNLVILEWSHEGACRAWLIDNPGVPKIGCKKYQHWDLMNNNYVEKWTHGLSGSWRYSLSDFIKSYTNIDIKLKSKHYYKTY